MLVLCCFVSLPLVVITTICLLLAKIKVQSGTLSSATVSLSLPPGPWSWPVVGSLPEMMLNKPAFRWTDGVMKEMGTDIACFHLGGVHVIPITCPKFAREVLKNQDANFLSRPLTFASSAISCGYKDVVLTPFGDQWRKMRKVLTSEIICPSRHKWLHDKRAEEADNFTRYIYNLTTGGSSSTSGLGNVNVRFVARHYCANVIRWLVFGQRYFGEPQPDGGPGPMEVEHMDASFTLLGLLFSFCVSNYLPCLLGLDLDGHEKMIKEANTKLDRIHDTVIEERWRQWSSSERQDGVQDFLDVLITLVDGDGKPLLNIEEVKAQCKDIILAAIDNPSNAVEWALVVMVSNTELLAKAVEEMDWVVGREQLVQESDIMELNYLKACIREAFRLHPVAPFNLPHVAVADTIIAGYRVPKGSHVMLSRMGLGQNPTVWDEPLHFKPKRHIGDNIKVVLTESELRFISFSTGRRGCIAASLGTTMGVMLFGRLLHGFTWTKPARVSAINLSESKHDLFMEKPLVLHAKPRLAAHLYPLMHR
ncbi:tyrosine N-monooxygenase-like [Hordeum vulgare subsp. vulgare]|uniref:tyrosine N-monooxygenase-like n=1 Tax=Hordeum vulgare subsp. vulgare TaxID=112509 RepID=UPI001D1A4C1D|nr:tyrosine N-monooxygenase-like [Hordeum vulgare subsp. vulgare]